MTHENKTRSIIRSSLFAGLTAVGGILSFPLPFSPVPLSLQSFFTLAAGIVLGPKYGAFSQLVYLLLGALGLPVFANRQGGFYHLFGPTGGFLWGFVLAAYVIGYLHEKQGKKKLRSLFFTLLTGLILIYLVGVLGLHLSLGISIKQGLLLGVFPFLVGDMVKLLGVMFFVQRIP